MPSSLISDAALGGSTPRAKPPIRWTYERILHALVEYLASVPAGTNPTQHDYGARAAKNGWPAVFTVQNQAKWSLMIEAARWLRETGEIVSLDLLRSCSTAAEARAQFQQGFPSVPSVADSPDEGSRDGRSGSSDHGCR